MIKDDFSSYVWLRKANATDAATATNEISAWIRTFSAMHVWIMDQLPSDCCIRQRFTVAYSPWANGKEAVNKYVIAACGALNTELKLGPHDCHDVLGIIQNVLLKKPIFHFDDFKGLDVLTVGRVTTLESV